MQVHVSDGTASDVVPRISEADLQVSRHHISVFLSTHTAYELFPKSGKVWIFASVFIMGVFFGYLNLTSANYFFILLI